MLPQFFIVKHKTIGIHKYLVWVVFALLCLIPLILLLIRGAGLWQTSLPSNYIILSWYPGCFLIGASLVRLSNFLAPASANELPDPKNLRDASRLLALGVVTLIGLRLIAMSLFPGGELRPGFLILIGVGGPLLLVFAAILSRIAQLISRYRADKAELEGFI